MDSEAISYKTCILARVYNATNNEFLRTKALVKNTIVNVDPNPFRLWCPKKFDVELNKNKLEETSNLFCNDTKLSSHVKAKFAGATNLLPD